MSIMFIIRQRFKIFLLIGFLFAIGYRLYGISTSHSFWVDEMQVSFFAKALIAGKMNLLQLYERLGYQFSYVMLVSIIYKLFSFGEIQARIISVIAGSIATLCAVKTARLYTKSAPILFTVFVLQCFSSTLLAYSTQNKPYALVFLFCQVFVYLSVRAIESDLTWKRLFSLVFLILLAGSFHQIALLLFFPLFALVYIKSNVPTTRFTVLILGIIFACIIYLLGDKSNHYIHTKNLFLKQYFLITFLFFGWLILRAKRKKVDIYVIGVLVIGWILSWNFIPYTHNIRYIVPAMSILFVFSPLAISELTKKVSVKYRTVLEISCCLILLIVLLYSKKISILPQLYYTPNNDFYGDVQIADYKRFAQLINDSKILKTNSFIIAPRSFIGFDYLDIKPSVYTQRSDAPVPSQYEGIPVVTTSKQLELIIQKHPEALVIVEKWHSHTPDDVQQLADQKMQKIIEVRSLPFTPNDEWPLVLYHWRNKIK